MSKLNRYIPDKGHGMTVWDEYAKAAMTGYLASWPEQQPISDPVAVGTSIGHIADAMLAERQKRMEDGK
jgi:hypothetical protein